MVWRASAAPPDRKQEEVRRAGGGEGRRAALAAPAGGLPGGWHAGAGVRDDPAGGFVRREPRADPADSWGPPGQASSPVWAAGGGRRSSDSVVGHGRP